MNKVENSNMIYACAYLNEYEDAKPYPWDPDWDWDYLEWIFQVARESGLRKVSRLDVCAGTTTYLFNINHEPSEAVFKWDSKARPEPLLYLHYQLDENRMAKHYGPRQYVWLPPKNN